MDNKQAVLDFMRVELLTKIPPDRGLEFKANGDAWLRCPYHSGGQEKTPSFKFTLDPQAPVPPGFCWCWSCKMKHGWNEAAALFDLTPISSSHLKRAQADNSYLKYLDLNDGEEQVPDLDLLQQWPLGVDWRFIPGKTLNRYGGRSIVFGKQPFLYLPAMVHGQQVGGINCRIVRNRSIKEEKAYINTSGNWSNVNVFGFDVANRQPRLPLWVVEGPRDTAWIRACGCRSAGLIGSNVSPQKLALIRELDPPSIIVATDPDEAGDGAATKLLEAFKNEIPVERFPFKEGQDPCKLSGRMIKRATRLMMRYG